MYTNVFYWQPSATAKNASLLTVVAIGRLAVKIAKTDSDGVGRK